MGDRDSLDAMAKTASSRREGGGDGGADVPSTMRREAPLTPACHQGPVLGAGGLGEASRPTRAEGRHGWSHRRSRSVPRHLHRHRVLLPRQGVRLRREVVTAPLVCGSGAHARQSGCCPAREWRRAALLAGASGLCAGLACLRAPIPPRRARHGGGTPLGRGAEVIHVLPDKGIELWGGAVPRRDSHQRAGQASSSAPSRRTGTPPTDQRPAEGGLGLVVPSGPRFGAGPCGLDASNRLLTAQRRDGGTPAPIAAPRPPLAGMAAVAARGGSWLPSR
jgi:hypothetical protein